MQELTQRARNLADISQGASTGLDQATHTYPVVGLASWQETMQNCLCLAHILLLLCVCQGTDLS